MKKLFKNKKLITISIVLLAILTPLKLALAVVPLLGSVQSIINLALGAIMNLYVGAVGFLTLQVAKFLIGIAGYNNFVNQPSVVIAWALVRDVANMILVIVLLIIAFATIFNVQKYSYKQLLPRLLIMAIAINFSRTIAGLMIDAGQVFMLTFVNAWSGAAAGNFVNALKLTEILELNPHLAEADAFNVTLGYIMAGIVITVTFIVLLAFALMLTLRVVMLWMLVAISPIAFALSAWPASKAQQRYADWWDQFVDNIVVGPAVAFFLWLSLAIIGGGDIGPTEFRMSEAASTGEQLPGGTPFNPSGNSPSTFGNLEHFSSYLIGTGMLIGSLAMVQKMRVAGAGAGSKMLGWAQTKGLNAVKVVSGARYVGERYKAFQSMRESARQERVREFGAKAYGIYGTLQANVGKGLKKLDVGEQWKEAANKKRSQAADLRRQAAQAKTAGNTVDSAKFSAQADALEKSAGRWEVGAKAAKAGQIAGAIVAAPVTGGLSGAVLAPLLGKRLQKGGEQAKAQAESYKYRNVMKELDGLKTAKRDEVTKKAKGIDVASKDEQMAAMIRMAQEGWYDALEVPPAFQQLKDIGADAKTQSAFESAAERAYPTMPHRDIATGAINPAKLQKAVKDGTLDIRKLRVEEITAENGTVPVEVTLSGTDAQFKDLTTTKGGKEATRDGLKAARRERLDVRANKGLTATGDAYDDNNQKISENIMRAGGDISAFEFDPKTGDFDASSPQADTVTKRFAHRQSFAKALKSKDAAEILLNVKANQVVNPQGALTEVGQTIIQELDKIGLSNAARDSLKSRVPDQMELIRTLVRYLDANPTASPELSKETQNKGYRFYR